MSLRPLTPALAEKAKKDLCEEASRVTADLQHLKEWIEKQPHLNACTDDQWLAAFLRNCKFSLERTKEKLDLHYSIRSTAPELYKLKHTDPIFQEIFNKGIFLHLPKTSAPDAPRVLLYRFGLYDPNKYHITDIMSVMNVLQRISLLEDDHSVVSGLINVLDMEGTSMGHILQATPALLKKCLVAVQDAIPISLQENHFINVPAGFDSIFNALKPLFYEDIRNKTYIYGKNNLDSMYKYVPKDILPKEYGGEGGDIVSIMDDERQKLKKHSAFLEKDYAYGTDESKRTGKPRTAETMFGLDGSFRKLDFD